MILKKIMLKLCHIKAIGDSLPHFLIGKCALFMDNLKDPISTQWMLPVSREQWQPIDRHLANDHLVLSILPPRRHQSTFLATFRCVPIGKREKYSINIKRRLIGFLLSVFYQFLMLICFNGGMLDACVRILFVFPEYLSMWG
jgi:hypothetical protein